MRGPLFIDIRFLSDPFFSSILPLVQGVSQKLANVYSYLWERIWSLFQKERLNDIFILKKKENTGFWGFFKTVDDRLKPYVLMQILDYEGNLLFSENNKIVNEIPKEVLRVLKGLTRQKRNQLFEEYLSVWLDYDRCFILCR